MIAVGVAAVDWPVLMDGGFLGRAEHSLLRKNEVRCEEQRDRSA